MHQIGIFDRKGLVASAFFLVEFHHEVLVVGNGELRKREDHALAALSPDHLHVVVGTQGPDDLLLNGRALGDLLIRDLEGEVIDLIMSFTSSGDSLPSSSM